jgi:uncharacterized membrane protein YhaH (DUF805 family)
MSVTQLLFSFKGRIRRLHWWVVVQTLVVALAAVMVVLAIAVPKEQASIWYVLAGAAGIGALMISIWLFVEIGFLRGTQGQNRFGPDPLGTLRADANL